MENEMFNLLVVEEFRNKLFNFSFTQADIVKEIAVRKKPYLMFERNKKKYLLEIEDEGDLPIQINHTTRFTHGKDVYYRIDDFTPIEIVPKKTMEFDEFMDRLADFKHDNQKDWRTWVLITLAAYLGKATIRLATTPGFGKNSLIQILQSLRGDAVVFQPSSAAAVEYRLINKLLAFDEINDLKGEDKVITRKLLKRIGDNMTTYSKSTRASAQYGTKDLYDISRLSVLIFYNDIDTYERDGNLVSSFFDFSWDKAILARYLPFKFEGEIDADQFGDFSLPMEAREVVDQYFDELKEFLLNLEYYKQKWVVELKNRKAYNFTVPPFVKTNRHKKVFKEIAKFARLYSDDKDIFQEMMYNVGNSIARYYQMIDKYETGSVVTLETAGKYDWNFEVSECIEESSSR